MIDLLTTRGKWFDWIYSGIKKFDWRKGYRCILEGDIICFKEADEWGTLTGKECFGKVSFVIHSNDFPSHFGWKGNEFTIFQFELIEVSE